MSQENSHQMSDTKVDIATSDAAIVRAIASMRGHSSFALLGSIYDVAKREYSFQGTLELALSIVSKLPGVHVKQHSPLEQTRVFSDDWKPR